MVVVNTANLTLYLFIRNVFPFHRSRHSKCYI